MIHLPTGERRSGSPTSSIASFHTAKSESIFPSSSSLSLQNVAQDLAHILSLPSSSTTTTTATTNHTHERFYSKDEGEAIGIDQDFGITGSFDIRTAKDGELTSDQIYGLGDGGIAPLAVSSPRGVMPRGYSDAPTTGSTTAAGTTTGTAIYTAIATGSTTSGRGKTALSPSSEQIPSSPTSNTSSTTPLAFLNPSQSSQSFSSLTSTSYASYTPGHQPFFFEPGRNTSRETLVGAESFMESFVSAGEGGGFFLGEKEDTIDGAGNGDKGTVGNAVLACGGGNGKKLIESPKLSDKVRKATSLYTAPKTFTTPSPTRHQNAASPNSPPTLVSDPNQQPRRHPDSGAYVDFEMKRSNSSSADDSMKEERMGRGDGEGVGRSASLNLRSGGYKHSHHPNHSTLKTPSTTLTTLATTITSPLTQSPTSHLPHQHHTVHPVNSSSPITHPTSHNEKQEKFDNFGARFDTISNVSHISTGSGGSSVVSMILGVDHEMRLPPPVMMAGSAMAMGVMGNGSGKGKALGLQGQGQVRPGSPVTINLPLPTSPSSPLSQSHHHPYHNPYSPTSPHSPPPDALPESESVWRRMYELSSEKRATMLAEMKQLERLTFTLKEKVEGLECEKGELVRKLGGELETVVESEEEEEEREMERRREKNDRGKHGGKKESRSVSRRRSKERDESRDGREPRDREQRDGRRRYDGYDNDPPTAVIDIATGNMIIDKRSRKSTTERTLAMNQSIYERSNSQFAATRSPTTAPTSPATVRTPTSQRSRSPIQSPRRSDDERDGRDGKDVREQRDHIVRKSRSRQSSGGKRKKESRQPMAPPPTANANSSGIMTNMGWNSASVNGSSGINTPASMTPSSSKRSSRLFEEPSLSNARYDRQERQERHERAKSSKSSKSSRSNRDGGSNNSTPTQNHYPKSTRKPRSRQSSNGHHQSSHSHGGERTKSGERTPVEGNVTPKANVQSGNGFFQRGLFTSRGGSAVSVITNPNASLTNASATHPQQPSIASSSNRSSRSNRYSHYEPPNSATTSTTANSQIHHSESEEDTKSRRSIWKKIFSKDQGPRQRYSGNSSTSNDRDSKRISGGSSIGSPIPQGGVSLLLKDGVGMGGGFLSLGDHEDLSMDKDLMSVISRDPMTPPRSHSPRMTGKNSHHRRKRSKTPSQSKTQDGQGLNPTFSPKMTKSHQNQTQNKPTRNATFPILAPGDSFLSLGDQEGFMDNDLLSVLNAESMSPMESSPVLSARSGKSGADQRRQRTTLILPPSQMDSREKQKNARMSHPLGAGGNSNIMLTLPPPPSNPPLHLLSASAPSNPSYLQQAAAANGGLLPTGFPISSVISESPTSSRSMDSFSERQSSVYSRHSRHSRHSRQSRSQSHSRGHSRKHTEGYASSSNEQQRRRVRRTKSASRSKRHSYGTLSDASGASGGYYPRHSASASAAVAAGQTQGRNNPRNGHIEDLLGRLFPNLSRNRTSTSSSVTTTSHRANSFRRDVVSDNEQYGEPPSPSIRHRRSSSSTIHRREKSGKSNKKDGKRKSWFRRAREKGRMAVSDSEEVVGGRGLMRKKKKRKSFRL